MITGIGRVLLLEPDGDEDEVHAAASTMPVGYVAEWNDGAVPTTRRTSAGS